MTAEGRVSTNTSARWTVTFRVTQRDSAGTRAQISYRSTFYRDSGQYQVTARPLGFANNWRGSGRCERR